MNLALMFTFRQVLVKQLNLELGFHMLGRDEGIMGRDPNCPR